jgi:antitoxin VapB
VSIGIDPLRPDDILVFDDRSAHCAPHLVGEPGRGQVARKTGSRGPKQRGITKQDAVKLAVRAELDRSDQAVPLRVRFAALRALHALPPATGDLADKAFFDELSGEL